MNKSNYRVCFERSRNRLKHHIITFEELVAPLSHGKIMVVVECLSIEECDQPETMTELSEILNFNCDAECDDWEDFLDYGFVVIESENAPEHLAEASLLIDFLRNEKYQNMIQADLFVDGILQASSWTGVTDVWKISPEIKKPAKSVVLRFPVERTNRHKDTDAKN